MSSTRAVRGNEATLYNDGGRCTLGFVTSDNSFPHCEDHIRPRRPESFSTATRAALLPGYLSMHLKHALVSMQNPNLLLVSS